MQHSTAPVRAAEHDGIDEEEFLHTLSNHRYYLWRWLGLHPRALCGASLIGDPDRPDPTVPCPHCAARTR